MDSRPGLLLAGVTFLRGNDAPRAKLARSSNGRRDLKTKAIPSVEWQLAQTRAPLGQSKCRLPLANSEELPIQTVSTLEKLLLLGRDDGVLDDFGDSEFHDFLGGDLDCLARCWIAAHPCF